MTGIFTWVIPTGDRVKAGQKAGRVNHGYISIKINKREYGAHRLAWLYVHGAWPDGDVDHINRDKSDNRIANLRQATRAQNLQNRQYAGAYWYSPRKKWRVNIRVDGKRLWIGDYNTHTDALAARADAVSKYHTHRPV
jgi:hypothetical protein